MIEIEMSKDVRDYQPRILGPLTRRQLICILIAAAYCVPLFFLLPISDIMTKCVVVFVCAIPAISCGWVELYKMPFEVFIKQVILTTIATPTKRKNKPVNSYDYLLEDPKPAPKKIQRSKTMKAIR